MFIFGPPVVTPQFCNRTLELRRILKVIEERYSNNINPVECPHLELSAPRRIGKSSLLLEARNRLKMNGYIPIYIQLLDIVNVEDFFFRLRDNVIEALPMTKGTYEKITEYFSKLKFNPFKTKPTYSSEGELSVEFEDVLSLTEGTWQEIGKKTFNLLRKYWKYKFVIFLDEVGFVRKMNEDSMTKQEFLNFLDVEFSMPNTPVFVLCGSQNFFFILRNIKAEIYQLWRRKFLRIPIGCFDEDSTVYKLFIPNFKSEKVFEDDFFSDDVVKGLSTMLYYISSGYPSIAQILGKEISFMLSYEKDTSGTLDKTKLKKIVFNVVEECIIKDMQSICHELLSEEALGENHEIYKKFIYQLYHNESLNTGPLYAEYDTYELDILLKDIEEQQYITIKGDTYTLSYNFLKYYIWHPRKDADIWKEIEELWNRFIP